MIRSLCLALAAVWMGAVPAHAQPSSAPDPTAAEARAEDIAAFRKNIFEADISYTAEARAEAERRLQRLTAERGSVSQAYFELELSRIAALADNGHTKASPHARSRLMNRIGLRLVPFGTDFHVLRARPEHAHLLGAKLIAVDGVDIAELREAGRSLVGGTPAWRDRTVPYFLESPEQMHAIGLIPDPRSARYRFLLTDGRIVQPRIAAEAPDSERPLKQADRWLFPERMKEEGDGWRTLLAPEEAPWAYRDPDTPFRLRHAPDMNAVVAEMRQVYSSGKSDIAQFAYDVEDALRETGARHLVLDLRQNGGGNLNTARAFMKRLPQIVPERIFVLTSPWTFSAAISSLGYLEQAAPEKVTIVGEMVGDRLEFFAEGGYESLPHASTMVSISTERHNYRTGCEGEADCHGSIVRFPIKVESLAPDIEAPWTIEAYRAGRDPGMEAVAAALGAE